MKQLFLILTLLYGFVASASAVDYQNSYKPQQQYQGGVYSTAEAAQGNPQGASFNSTSSYSKQLDEKTRVNTSAQMMNTQYERAYTVPVSATGVTGGVTTEDNSTNPGPRRIGHRPGTGSEPVEDIDPNPDVPMGNTPWLFMLLLATVYIAIRLRKNHVA